MSSRRATSTAVAVTAGLWITILGVASPTAVADPTIYVPGSGTLTWAEFTYCASHIGECNNAKDAAQWAEGVTIGKYGGNNEELHNGVPDAFRHCLWSGAMAQRMGTDTALTIANNHELLDSAPGSEASMDSYNNHIGVTIGEQSNGVGTSDTWGWIMHECSERADTGALYGQGGQMGAGTVG
jgi:hypothetical protein